MFLRCRYTLLHRRTDLGDLGSHETYEVGRGDFKLQSAYAGAYVYVAVLHAARMYVCREPLLHAYGRAAAADISRRGQQLLHVQHLDAFVSRSLGRGLKINFVVARHHTYDVSRAVAREYQRLEYGGDILAQLLGHMCCGEVLLVNGIGYEFIRYAGLVEQACRICLFDLLL